MHNDAWDGTLSNAVNDVTVNIMHPLLDEKHFYPSVHIAYYHAIAFSKHGT